MNDEELLGLIFSIVFVICTAIFAFYIWFRDGANKCSRNTLKFWNENAIGSVSRFDEIKQHPLVWKVGSVLMFLAGVLGLFYAIKLLK